MAAVAIRLHWLPSLTRLTPRTGWFVLSKPHTQPIPSAAHPSARVIRLAPAPKPGDAQRFSTAMLPHLDDAYTFARYLTRGDAVSEDIVHDAYIRALRAYPGFRGGDGKAWILSIVRNCFLTWAKARARGRMVSDEDVLAAARDERTPAHALEDQDTGAAMRRLIEALPAQLSEVIVLREIEELSYREIADTLAIPIGTVMSRLARAREQLAKAWREGGGAA
jgi:RNA polymerase sigma-70 factor (ECF subfamily)